jgi:hypothetical protein
LKFNDEISEGGGLMLEISEKVKESLKSTNQQLRKKYSTKDSLDIKNLRKIIQEELNELVKLAKMSEQNSQEWLANKTIVGVDGSVNKIGGNYPHHIYLLQALAKSITKEDVLESELFCPLLKASRKEINNFIKEQQKKGIKIHAQESATKIKISKLAELELEVALKAIGKWHPKLIMLDGSLIRYRIESEDKWKDLKEMAIKEEVLLLGVIEEIGTREVGKRLVENLGELDYYDRELLFGVLDVGEMLELEFKSGFKTAFLRSSRDPQVIGIDVLKEQQQDLKKMADLVYTLTPIDGRGIPLWLDIVDNEVRISDKMMESLVETYLDPDLKRRLFYSKRNDRIY